MDKSRRSVFKIIGGVTAFTALPLSTKGFAAFNTRIQAPSTTNISQWQRPTENDFQIIVNRNKKLFLDRVLDIFENEIIPKTMEGVKEGNKLFGSAILRKKDLSTVVIATNTETENPLMHGEVTGIFDFYNIPKSERPAPQDTIFISTHEPCPLCLSSITWAGFDNFFYLFSYEDSRDKYGIPHDITMLDEIFRLPDGAYNEKNKYWSSWSIPYLVQQLSIEEKRSVVERIENIKVSYAHMSDIYQKAKSDGVGADVPLK